MEWISVEDKLPEYHTPVIVFIEDRCSVMTTMFLYDFTLARVCRSEGFLEHGVTHWMPLPEPPESNKNKQSYINKLFHN